MSLPNAYPVEDFPHPQPEKSLERGHLVLRDRYRDDETDKE